MPRTKTAPEIARAKAGYTLADAARRLQCTEKHLREMERGTRPTPFYTAEVLSHFYKCRMEVFLNVREQTQTAGADARCLTAAGMGDISHHRSDARRFPSQKTRRYRGPKTPILILE